MTPLSFVVIAFVLALLVMSFAFFGGAVPVALPIAAIVIAAISFGNFRRRRPDDSPRYEDAKRHAEGTAHPQPGDPTTLYTGDPDPGTDRPPRR